MRINQNISAMNTYSRLTSANTAKSGSLQKLSSGLRINKAGDDAAGLAISEKMRGQISGLNQASKNAQDGISLIQTAEGALSETHSILQRMRELAVQSANDTNTDTDRAEIQKEVNQLSQEITRISTDTEFNTQNLLNGEYKDKKFHIGANADQKTTIDISDMGSKSLGVQGAVNTATAGDITVVTQGDKITKIDIKKAAASGGTGATHSATGGVITIEVAFSGAVNKASNDDVKKILEGYGLDVSIATGSTAATAVTVATGTLAVSTDDTINQKYGINVSTQSGADSAITTIDDAIAKVSAERSKLGATQNRLDHTINNLTATSENLSAAESRIRDVDMAQEMMEFTKNNILSQAATSMLAQANQMPQSVLQLLQ